MKRDVVVSCILICLLASGTVLLSGCTALNTGGTGSQSRVIPGQAIELLEPGPEDLRYLGVDGEPTVITLEDIAAPVLIIEAFDTYCPYCQRAAPDLNRLYRLIEERNLAGTVKMLGIGLGNSRYEVKLFESKQDVPFPIFPDQTSESGRELGVEAVPVLIILERDGEGYRIAFEEKPPIASPETLLQRVLSRTGARSGEG